MKFTKDFKNKTSNEIPFNCWKFWIYPMTKSRERIVWIDHNQIWQILSTFLTPFTFLLLVHYKIEIQNNTSEIQQHTMAPINHCRCKTRFNSPETNLQDLYHHSIHWEFSSWGKHILKMIKLKNCIIYCLSKENI